MLMKLSRWVTTNEKPRVGSYSCHSTLHGVKQQKFYSCDFWCVAFWGCYNPTPLIESRPRD